MIALDYSTVVTIVRRSLYHECIVMDVWRPGGDVVVKFAGGRMELFDEFDPRVTIGRETKEELNLSLRSRDRLNLLRREHQVLGRFGPHDKFFYWAWRSAFKGKLRTEPMWDGSSWLGVPRWVRVSDLVEGSKGKPPLLPQHAVILPDFLALGFR